ncbi:13189_t:CDS:1, partial [Racocetra persica]
AIECLEVQQVRSVNVLKVKEMTKRLLNGLTKIAGLEYKKGR